MRVSHTWVCTYPQDSVTTTLTRGTVAQVLGRCDDGKVGNHVGDKNPYSSYSELIFLI